ncbi:MAG: hypothetical protein Gaeavirus3_19 [Gaeavirus sp.]|uniref:Uncharacterized protein n=1 Tax=Gaeavirus sp. TaxID=2487767 RepID=A0A3G4ZYG9_9VIRU|nr:MAG: hypothetical protein Gaeavirus3_19 [Gaeavirus sp.]
MVEEDDETFVDVDDYIRDNTCDIYQFQMNCLDLVVRHIGVGSDVPDVIIQENFGLGGQCSMYNCVYKLTELDSMIDKFFPIIKLVHVDKELKTVYCIGVKINIHIGFNENISDFNVYFMYSVLASSKRNEHDDGAEDEEFHDVQFEYIDLDKNINRDNIIEKLLENIINLGTKIL